VPRFDGQRLSELLIVRPGGHHKRDRPLHRSVSLGYVTDNGPNFSSPRVMRELPRAPNQNGESAVTLEWRLSQRESIDSARGRSNLSRKTTGLPSFRLYLPPVAPGLLKPQRSVAEGLRTLNANDSTLSGNDSPSASHILQSYHRILSLPVKGDGPRQVGYSSKRTGSLADREKSVSAEASASCRLDQTASTTSTISSRGSDNDDTTYTVASTVATAMSSQQHHPLQHPQHVASNEVNNSSTEIHQGRNRGPQHLGARATDERQRNPHPPSLSFLNDLGRLFLLRSNDSHSHSNAQSTTQLHYRNYQSHQERLRMSLEYHLEKLEHSQVSRNRPQFSLARAGRTQSSGPLFVQNEEIICGSSSWLMLNTGYTSTTKWIFIVIALVSASSFVWGNISLSHYPDSYFFSSMLSYKIDGRYRGVARLAKNTNREMHKNLFRASKLSGEFVVDKAYTLAINSKAFASYRVHCHESAVRYVGWMFPSRSSRFCNKNRAYSSDFNFWGGDDIVPSHLHSLWVQPKFIDSVRPVEETNGSKHYPLLMHKKINSMSGKQAANQIDDNGPEIDVKSSRATKIPQVRITEVVSSASPQTRVLLLQGGNGRGAAETECTTTAEQADSQDALEEHLSIGQEVAAKANTAKEMPVLRAEILTGIEQGPISEQPLHQSSDVKSDVHSIGIVNECKEPFVADLKKSSLSNDGHPCAANRLLGASSVLNDNANNHSVDSCEFEVEEARDTVADQATMILPVENSRHSNVEIVISTENLRCDDEAWHCIDKSLLSFTDGKCFFIASNSVDDMTNMDAHKVPLSFEFRENVMNMICINAIEQTEQAPTDSNSYEGPLVFVAKAEDDHMTNIVSENLVVEMAGEAFQKVARHFLKRRQRTRDRHWWRRFKDAMVTHYDFENEDMVDLYSTLN
jgi:hypothetical protein